MGRGKHQATLALIEAAKGILEEIQPASVRAVCYRLFAAGVIPDMSTERSVKRVGRELVWARENGVIPWGWVVDETREVEQIAAWDDIDARIGEVGRYYRRDYWQDQPNRVEVWSEKGTVRGTLKPVLDAFGVPFRVLHGFGSATAVYDAADDSGWKPIIAIYVGDYDPSGLYMSAADLPARLDRYGGRVSIVRVALVESDLAGLPGFDLATKRSDPRHNWFRDRYGTRCWELDAMPPPDLRTRVEASILSLIDRREWKRSAKVEAAEQETLRTVAANWRDLISGHVPK